MFCMLGSTADTTHASVVVAFEECPSLFYVKEDFGSCVLFARGSHLEITHYSTSPCIWHVSLGEYTKIAFFCERLPENVPYSVRCLV